LRSRDIWFFRPAQEFWSGVKAENLDRDLQGAHRLSEHATLAKTQSLQVTSLASL